MDVQSLLDRISFLEEEVHRCYAEIEDYEVKIEAYEDALKKVKIEATEDVLNEFKAALRN